MSKWVYEKDASVWSGSKWARIDEITVTGVMPQGETLVLILRRFKRGIWLLFVSKPG
jgi:hypothetical protein